MARRRMTTALAPQTAQEPSDVPPSAEEELARVTEYALAHPANRAGRTTLAKRRLMFRLLMTRGVVYCYAPAASQGLPKLGHGTIGERVNVLMELLASAVLPRERWLEAKVASFVLGLSPQQWSALSFQQCCAILFYVDAEFLACRPGRQSMRLVARIVRMMRQWQPGVRYEPWIVERLAHCRAAHPTAPVPTTLVRVLLRSDSARTRAFAFMLLGTLAAEPACTGPESS